MKIISDPLELRKSLIKERNVARNGWDRGDEPSGLCLKRRIPGTDLMNKAYSLGSHVVSTFLIKISTLL